MTAKILDGKKTSLALREKLKQEIDKRTKKGIAQPKLAVILVGNNKSSEIYVNNKKKACKEVGILSDAHELSESTTTEELLNLLDTLNSDQTVSGIIVQLPLPKHINTRLVLESVSPIKDVDGFHPYNVGRLAQRNPGLRPCTPYGIIQMLNIYDINVTGKNAVIVGASNIVGRPMALELLLKGATTTICHKFTKDLQEVVKTAELLVVATGQTHLIKKDWIKKDAIVIDVGISRMQDGTIKGDVDFENAKEIASYITPVPGGVGPMTVTTLLQNTLLAQKIELGAV